MDLSRWIERHAAFQPDKPAIRFEGTTLTYGALDARVRALARGLKHGLGVGRGDRVAYLGGNHPDLLALPFACARLGAMLVPLNWRLATPEHAFILQDAAAKALVVEAAFAERVGELQAAVPACRVVGLDFDGGAHAPALDALTEAKGDDRNPHIDHGCPLLIVYTSGTTGRPKGAVLTQNALLWNAVNSAHMHDLTAADRVLTVLPMFHVGGLNIQTTPALHAGASVTLHRRFDPTATLAAIAAERPTLLVLVPATMQACINHPAWRDADLSSLRLLTTGSSAVPQPLIDAFEARGVPVIQVYGATETAPIAVYQRAEIRAKPGATGRAGLHCEARVLGDDGGDCPPGTPGEIAVRGPNVMVEYWGNAAATADALRGGWYRTGDVGYTDADGDLFVVDRKTNVIISGGENVYPAELERVLHAIPGVAEAAVVGRPDPRWGEVAVAVVVRAPGAALDEAAVLAAFAGELARFKHPRAVLFADSLPRNAMGKVQHFALKERIRARADDETC